MSPGPDQLYDVGVAGIVARMLKVPDGTIRILVQGTERVRVGDYVTEEPYLVARIEPLPDVVEPTPELEALTRNVQRTFTEIIEQIPYLPEELQLAVTNVDDPSALAHLIAGALRISTEEKQELLEEVDVGRRLRRLSEILARELEVIQLGSKIQSQVQSEIEKGQREYYLREQLKAIQQELGEARRAAGRDQRAAGADRGGEPSRARPQAGRARAGAPGAPAAGGRRVRRHPHLPRVAGRAAVERDHRGQPRHRSRARGPRRRPLRPREGQGPDPRVPGGAQADAGGRLLRAVRAAEPPRARSSASSGRRGWARRASADRSRGRSGRQFERISVGGVRDEAEIRGHRRTYIGAMPGTIVRALRDAGSRNPVFMIDEIDKMGADFRGDPSSAMLEVLDPAQNDSFRDHYLDLEFDLSEVMFITTANTLDTVPPALQDRMEVISLSGYTLDEKLHIAKRYLVPRQIEQNGLARGRISFTDAALRAIIEEYTREAGVRNLEREIGSVCRKVAREVAEGKVEGQDDDLRQARARAARQAPLLRRAAAAHQGPRGGDRARLDAGRRRGAVRRGDRDAGRRQADDHRPARRGDARVGPGGAVVGARQRRAGWRRTFPRTGSPPTTSTSTCPAGAVPKDGPSAGVAMAVALASLVSGKPVRADVAMTGEVTLTGQVLPVGGLKEKSLAAQSAGIKRIIVPERNEGDIAEIPEHERKGARVRLRGPDREALEAAL